jgi:hypothetical protein
MEDSKTVNDELVVCLDGYDSRRKAFYAPFESYNSHKQYGGIRGL